MLTKSDHISLGGGVVLLQGPLVYAGLALILILLYLASRLRRAVWSDFGVLWPKSWLRTILLGLGVALDPGTWIDRHD